MTSIRFRQKQPGDWVCIIDESSLSPVAIVLLEGFSDHIGECLGRVLGVHGISPDDRLRLGGLLGEIGDRLRSDDGAREATETDFWQTIISPLDVSFWCAMAALDLLDEDMAEAVSLYSKSVACLAAFETSLIWLENFEAVGDSRGDGVKKIDPAVIGALGAQARWEPRNETMKYALEKFDEKKWQSRAEGVRKILPDVCAKAKEVGFSYVESNIERTIHNWLRNATCSS